VQQLFLVGKFIAQKTEGIVWEFGGIFDTREAAETACYDDKYCVCSVALNQPAPQESVEFADCIYPLYRGEKG